MKKLVSIIILCLACISGLEAQHIWKPIGNQGIFMGVGPGGSLYSYYGSNSSVRRTKAIPGKLCWVTKRASTVTLTGIVSASPQKEESLSLKAILTGHSIPTTMAILGNRPRQPLWFMKRPLNIFTPQTTTRWWA